MRSTNPFTRNAGILAALLFLVVSIVMVGCTSGEAKTREAERTSVSKALPASAIEPRIRGQVEDAVASKDALSSVQLPSIKGEEQAILTFAPEVPPVITRNHATRVVVDMEVREVVKELADGVQYTFWTFGGEAPGPMIRVREGDLVEFHLKNHPNNRLPHNIDLHAVTGTGGGAEATLIVPGKQAVMEFGAMQPGLYVYHCATAPVGLHIANGMYGLILVQPEEGLPEVDREYYVMQSEFYTKGKFKEAGLQNFDRDKAIAEEPDYVVFNGAVDALTGTNALQASVGEKVRLYVGNGGPNLTSSFHVIGEIFDKVYGEGGTIVNQHNVQTTLIPAGGSTIVEFSTDVPGRLTLVDHAIFRAFEKGTVGIINVIGPENHDIFTGQLETSDYTGDTVRDLASQSN